MSDLHDWSTTPADNATADAAINWAEGQAPSTVNGSARAMMSRVAEWRRDLAPTRSSSGTGNAYVVAGLTGLTGAYRDGETISFVADRTNTSNCTLNLNARGAIPLRPSVGISHGAGEIIANQVVTAYYRQASNEFLTSNTGYHVNAMTNGLLTQSVLGRLISIGTPVLSLAPSPAAGYIRLNEITQNYFKSNWPELNTWLASLSYPWGSTATTFALPPAAGYFPRFAGSSTAIDPDGPRSAGSTQADTNQLHNHVAYVYGAGSHKHVYQRYPISGSAPGGAGQSLVSSTASAVDTDTVADHTHSADIGSSGGSESRPKNIAIHLDVFASSALAVGTLGAFGFPFAWDTGTAAADPGVARVRGNSATLSAITAIYINQVDAWGVSLETLLAASHVGLKIRLTKVGAPANTIVASVTGAATDNGSYVTIPVAVQVSNGTLSNSDVMALEMFGGVGAAGPTGATGSQGPGGVSAGFFWNFSSTVTMADPGAGALRFNNAAFASVTAIAFDDTCANTGNPDVSAHLLTWDDSTSTTKGSLRVHKVSAPENWVEFAVTGLTDQPGWVQLAVTYVGAAGTISNTDSVGAVFSRAGDKGLDGVGAGDVTAAAAFATDNRIIRSDGTVKGVQSSGVTIDDTNNVSGLGYLDVGEISAPASPAANIARLYSYDVSGTTRLAYKDSAGAITPLTVSSSTAIPAIIPGGRLTLTTVLTSSVTGATTIYYAPYIHRYVPLYDGSAFVVTDIGGELSQTTTDATKSPAACTTNSNYDLFVWSDSGTYRCTRGPAWASATARGTGAATTELERVNGVLVNKIAITNGPAARRGTYVGTIRTNASSQANFKLGSSAAGGGNAILGVWNNYNRVRLCTSVIDSTVSWTYGSTTVRAMNNSTSNRIEVINGLADDSASIILAGRSYLDTNGDAGDCGIGVDSTTAFTSPFSSWYLATSLGAVTTTASVTHSALGYHYYQALEAMPNGTSTMYGDPYFALQIIWMG
jgi:hypothetical protein